MITNSEGKTLLSQIKELSPRSKAALKSQKIFTLEDALRLSDSELTSIEGVGQASVDKLRAIARGEFQPSETSKVQKSNIEYVEQKSLSNANTYTAVSEAERLAREVILELVKSSGKVRADYAQEAWTLAEKFLESKKLFEKAQSSLVSMEQYKNKVSPLPKRVIVPQTVELISPTNVNRTWNTVPGSPQYPSPPAMIDDDGEDLNASQGNDYPDVVDDTF